VKLCELHRQDAKVKFDYFFFCLLLASSSDLFFLFFIFHLLDKGENEAVGYNHSPLILSYPSCIEIDRLGVIATNIFEQMENQWLLIHHHGSSVSNYIPRSVCVYYFFLIVDYDLYGTCCDHIHSTFRSNNCLTRLKEGVKVVQAL